MALETEIKTKIPDTIMPEKLCSDPRVLSYLKVPFHDIKMESHYFDTPDSACSARHWALRLRSEDGTNIATLKTAGTRSPNGLFSRGEWQTPADDFVSAVPQLIHLGAPAELEEIVKNQPLEEKCCVLFTRRSSVLELDSETRVDMCIDQGEILAEGKSESIYELELELLFGSLDKMIEFSSYLTETYGLQEEMISKYERALRLIRKR